MIFLDSIEKINNFIISKINFQDNEIKLNKKYYLLIDDETIEGNPENFDFEVINFEEFLSQLDIEFIINRYEILLVSEIEHYQLDFISAFSNYFKSYNTELSQKIYYENTILALKNSISRFSQSLNDKRDLDYPLNSIQKITTNEFSEAHLGIIRILENEFGKHINPEINIESRKTIFGLEDKFVEKFYNELIAYELFNEPVSKNLFFKILNNNYANDNKITLRLKSLPEFYYLVSFLAEKYAAKSMVFYQQISDRFLVSTNAKSNISFDAKKIADGISNLNQSVASRVVKKSSEIINIVNNLK